MRTQKVILMNPKIFLAGNENIGKAGKKAVDL